MSEITYRWRIAVHEAGHGLLATHVGNKVTLISIKPGAHFSGAAHHQSYEGTTQYTMPQRHILVCVAGCVAERIILGNNDPDLCVTDMFQAWVGAVGPTVKGDPEKEPIAEMLFYSKAPMSDPRWPNRAEAENNLTTMEDECRKVIEIKKVELERLAIHLDAHEECPGSDIPSICDGTWRAPKTANQPLEEPQ